MEPAKQPSELLSELIAFLKYVEWLPTLHGVRFFSQDIWSKVPSSWKAALEELSEEELYLLPIDPSIRRKSWPLSLLSFFKCIDRYQIANIVPKIQDVVPQPISLMTSSWPADLGPRIIRASGMSPKKFHEIDVLCPILVQLASDLGTNRIIDLGCGQGYLCNALGVCSTLEILGIDSSSHQIQGAQKRLKTLIKELGIQLRKGQPWGAHLTLEPRITYLEMPITCSMTANDLSETIAETGSESLGGILVGLHTCGDLAASMLRMFVSSPQLDAILNVGCCYNLMTVKNEKATDADVTIPGYPMSQVCAKSMPTLIRDVRSLACQSVERRHFNQADMERVHKSHSYRALFQYILENEFKLTERQYSGPINQEHYGSFVSYANAIMTKIGLPSAQISNEKLDELWQTLGLRWHKPICLFDSLRTALAPVVESLILLDRVVFMRENGFDASMVALFDPAVSPRFVGILASRRK